MQGKALAARQFYRTVGRLDVADAMDSRRSLNTFLLWGGGITALVLAPVGFLVGYFVFFANLIDDTLTTGAPEDAIVGNPGLWIMVGSIGVGVAAIVAAIVGYVRDSDPLELPAKHKLADDYNASKGLAQAPPEEDSIDWALAPVVTLQYQGLAFSVTF